MPRAKKPMVLHGLIKETAAKNFLVDVVNFEPWPHPQEEAFWKRWGWMFPEYDWANAEDRHAFSVYLMSGLHRYLKDAWRAGGLREREWWVYRARIHFNAIRIERTEEGRRLLQQKGTDAILELSRLKESLPEITPVDVCLQFFQQILNRTAVCQNGLCERPFFLVRKFGQKYCTSACATPSRRKAKSAWWKAEGKAWREQRKKKLNKSKEAK